MLLHRNSGDAKLLDEMEVEDEAIVTSEFPTKEIVGTAEQQGSDDAVKFEIVDESVGSSEITTAPNNRAEQNSPAKPWDFSNRKVMVLNMMKFHNAKAATKLVDEWLKDLPDVHYDKIKKPPKNDWMTITLQHQDMVQPFIDYINQSNILNQRGKKVTAKLAAATEEDRKRKHSSALDGTTAEDDPSSHRKRQKNQHVRRYVNVEEIKDKVIPLWKYTESEQLNIKMKDMIKKCAIKIVSEIKAKFRILAKEKKRKSSLDDLYPWVAQKIPICIEPIRSAPSPLRNKCEFTFGYRYLYKKNVDNNHSTEAKEIETVEVASEGVNLENTDEPTSKVPAVGFLVMGWAGGVSHPKGLPNIPTEVCALVDVMDDFLKTSPLYPYDSTTHRGFWRLLTVRTSRRTNECMVIIQHTPPSTGGQGDDTTYDYTNEFEADKARLIKILTDAELPTTPDLTPMKVTSIFFQEFDGVSSPPPEHPVQHAFGKLFLTERLGKCLFQISPGAFFQVNTEGAEILYQLVVDKVKEVATSPESTLLFDVCCGTGTIGLTCLKEGAVGRVIGVDISDPAIEDAKQNAILNGFGSNDDVHSDKTRFVAARAEQVLGQEIARAKSETLANSTTITTFVAVVDPAREGLHADVVKTLRANERIQRLVYVSCNPTATLIRDAALLCAPSTKRYKGRPFRISSATPVDMFPLTDHCEMVMTFDRLSDAEMTSASCSKVETT